jgi:hypothetical protein
MFNLGATQHKLMHSVDRMQNVFILNLVHIITIEV